MTTSSTRQVLIITTTLGYHHDSIPTALAALHSHAASNHPHLTFTSISTLSQVSLYFDTPTSLSSFSALIFLSTTGDIFTPLQLTNLLHFASSPAKAIIGIHSATATHVGDARFERIFGASFDYHPPFQRGVLVKLTAFSSPPLDVAGASSEKRESEVAHGHLSVRNLPSRTTVEDEQYNFLSDPRESGVRVIAEWDRSSYVDKESGVRRKEEMGKLQPAVWCREGGGGGGGRDRVASSGSGSGNIDEEEVKCRVWYTSLGHSEEIWREEWFVKHVFDGIAWALRVSE